MIFWIFLLLQTSLFQPHFAVPVAPIFKAPDDTDRIEFFDELNKHDYSDYMNGVLNELQSDKEFLKEIEKNKGANTAEQYVEYLQSASENARNKLDEIKRREIIRLNKLEKMFKKMSEKDKGHLTPEKSNEIVNTMINNSRSHISSNNQSRFTKEDLQSLINRATHDIYMVDRASEMQYQRGQIRKRIRERRLLSETKDPEERKRLEQKFAERRKKRRTLSKVHEPGSEQQLKDVWSGQDHLDPSSYNSKTFFKLHDLNQDDHWDIAEVEALVQSDVQKMHSPEDDSTDNQERFYETMKMRQHFMEKIDFNKDQLISMEEFLKFEKSADYKKDEEWKNEENAPSIDSEEDWLKYQEEVSKTINENLVKIDEVPKKGLIVEKL